jgi:hypothetical protein
MEKIYHIYAKDKCLLHSIKEEEFNSYMEHIKQYDWFDED